MYINPNLVAALNVAYPGGTYTLGPQGTNILSNGTILDLSYIRPDDLGSDFNLLSSDRQAVIVQAICDKTSGFSRTAVSILDDADQTLTPQPVAPNVVQSEGIIAADE